MSVVGLGCVKTPTFNLRVEIPSRFRKFENQKCLRPLLGEDDRENNSTHSRLVHVFTQPGAIATKTLRPRYVCSPADSDRRAHMARGPKSANERTRFPGRGWRRGRAITSAAVTLWTSDGDVRTLRLEDRR